MKKIGVTGGIGSGKTFVCHILEKMGYPVFYTDLIAKDIMTSDPILKEQIKTLFGAAAYFQDGTLNKQLVASAIFSDESVRLKVNSYVHPAVYRAFDEWAKQHVSKLVFIESALMIETGFYKELDKVILVVADEITRLHRVAKRDNIPHDKVQERMMVQSNDEHKKTLADFVIDNSENKLIVPQLADILKILQEEC